MWGQLLQFAYLICAVVAVGYKIFKMTVKVLLRH